MVGGGVSDGEGTASAPTTADPADVGTKDPTSAGRWAESAGEGQNQLVQEDRKNQQVQRPGPSPLAQSSAQEPEPASSPVQERPSAP